MRKKTTLIAAYGASMLASALYWGSVQMFLVDAGASNTVTTAVYSLPWIVGVASIPFGRLVDIYGNKKMLGVLAGLLSALSLLPVSAWPSTSSAALSGLANTAAWALLSPIFYEEAMSSIGEAEGAGILVATGSMGWTLGWGAAGIVYSSAGITGSAASAIIIQLLALPPLWHSLEGEKRMKLIDALRALPARPHVSSLGIAVLIWIFFSAYLASYELWCITLYRVLKDPRIYGASLVAAGLTSTAATPLASRIGRERGLRALSMASAALFTLTNSAFILAYSPLPLTLAFITPLWPFVSVFSYMYARRVWGGATGPGVVDALWSIAGAAAPLAGVISDAAGVPVALMSSILAGIMALSLLAALGKRYMEEGEDSLREEV